MKTGQLVTGDFEENTMTFEIKGDMVLKAGEYVILTKEDFKQQIIDAVEFGAMDRNFFVSEKEIAEKYYNDKYKP